MDTDTPVDSTAAAPQPQPITPSALPEVELFAAMLVLMLLLDRKAHQQASRSLCNDWHVRIHRLRLNHPSPVDHQFLSPFARVFAM
jgi:hypothetical protein